MAIERLRFSAGRSGGHTCVGARADQGSGPQGHDSRVQIPSGAPMVPSPSGIGVGLDACRGECTAGASVVRCVGT